MEYSTGKKDIIKLLQPFSYDIQKKLFFLLEMLTFSNNLVRRKRLLSGAWVANTDVAGHRIFYAIPVKESIGILSVGNQYTRKKDILAVEKKMKRLRVMQ